MYLKVRNCFRFRLCEQITSCMYGSQSAVTFPFYKNEQPRLVPKHELALALRKRIVCTIRKKNRNKGRRKSQSVLHLKSPTMQKRYPACFTSIFLYVILLFCFGLVNLPLGYAQSLAECAMWRKFGFCSVFW